MLFHFTLNRIVLVFFTSVMLFFSFSFPLSLPDIKDFLPLSYWVTPATAGCSWRPWKKRMQCIALAFLLKRMRNGKWKPIFCHFLHFLSSHFPSFSPFLLKVKKVVLTQELNFVNSKFKILLYVAWQKLLPKPLGGEKAQWELYLPLLKHPFSVDNEPGNSWSKWLVVPRRCRATESHVMVTVLQ